MPPHPFAGNPTQWYQNDPLADKRQNLFYTDQEIAKLCRSISNTMQMLEDVELTIDTRNELLQKMCDLTNMKAGLNAERVKLTAEFHEAEQKMLAERAARHREEELKEERENKMQKHDGGRGGRSSRGGRGGRN
jgi:hypothetical protein